MRSSASELVLSVSTKIIKIEHKRSALIPSCRALECQLFTGICVLKQFSKFNGLIERERNLGLHARFGVEATDSKKY